ncbi:Uncharacterized protein Adt_27018 [Abeliophyllum distichum]|uniref:Uncharacterized protein n=1 Tax=Abeliophyllum distichum TaxID=126358 RepID=A0ABD1RSJ7_9LAMI
MKLQMLGIFILKISILEQKIGIDSITEVVATENQTVAQVPSFAATQTVAPTGHVIDPINHGEKPKKFNGLNFKRWQQKMLFYLTTLNLARFLIEDAPKLKQGERDIQAVSAVEAWKHSDFLCQNYVMNSLTDSLYNVYSTMKTRRKNYGSL